jgi:hypothetical protein
MAYTQVTLGTLKARLADRYEAVPYWTPEEARRALNEALRIYSAATGFWRTVVSVPTVPNDHYVALPGTLVQAARVTWNGLPLEPVTLTDLSWGIRNWRRTTTATPGAPPRPVYWARASLTLLAIYPADAFASVGGTHALQVNGVRQTPILINDSDFVDLGQEQFDVLLGYAQHVLAFKIGGQALVSTYPGWLAFLQAAARENRQFAKSLFYRKVMGLDVLHRVRGTEKDVQSAVDEAEQSVGQTIQTARYLGPDR